MRNLRKNNNQNNGNKLSENFNKIYRRNKILSFAILPLLVFMLSSTTNKNVEINNNLFPEINGEREAFDGIVGSLRKENCLEMMVSSVSVKRNGNDEHSFTGFGTTRVKLEHGSVRSEPTGIDTGFSDRSRFNGTKTKEHVYLSFSNNRFKIKVRLQTWGNRTIELLNPTLEERDQGYFATGNYHNGRRTIYYTIAIHKDCGSSISTNNSIGNFITSG